MPEPHCRLLEGGGVARRGRPGADRVAGGAAVDHEEKLQNLPLPSCWKGASASRSCPPGRDRARAGDLLSVHHEPEAARHGPEGHVDQVGAQVWLIVVESPFESVAVRKISR